MITSARIETRAFQASIAGGEFMAWVHDVTAVEARDLPGDRMDTLTFKTAHGYLVAFLPPRVAKAMAEAFAQAMADEREQQAGAA